MVAHLVSILTWVLVLVLIKFHYITAQSPIYSHLVSKKLAVLDYPVWVEYGGIGLSGVA